MMKTSYLSKLFFFLAAALLLAGCTIAPKSTPVPVEGQERDQILAKAEPIAEHVFLGMRDHDYATFSSDFDATMQKAETQAAFNQMMAKIDPIIGAYQSRQVAKVEKVGTHVAVTYTTKYELENPVTWRIVLTPGDTMQVAGLWYDSPKLRGQ